jgi:hypothetical protein
LTFFDKNLKFWYPSKFDNQLVAKKRRRSADMVALGVTYNQTLYEDDTLGGGNLSSR